MNRVTLSSVAVVCGLAASLAHGTVIETFDSPNTLQNNNGNFAFSPPIQGAWTAARGGQIINNPTNVQIITNPPTGGGYGTAYKNIFTDNKPPPGSGLTNGVVDISGNDTLQLDVTINSGTAGIFVDLQDGAGNAYQYFFGYGLVGDAAANGAPQVPGVTITQGAAPNQLILRAPLATPYADLNGTGTFDFSQLVLFRLEDDPGVNPAYNIAFNDLSAINSVPEPVSAAALVLGGLLLKRRRHT